jgi:hypothetical protein
MKGRAATFCRSLQLFSVRQENIAEDQFSGQKALISYKVQNEEIKICDSS